MTFEELSIHQDIKSVLTQSAKTGRIAHGQYFESVDGGGALPMAVAYAQAILGGAPDMFGGVDDRAARLEHPDLHIIFPMVQSVDKTCDSRVDEFRQAYRANPYLSYTQWLLTRDEKSKKAIISKHEAENMAKKLSLRSFEGGYKILLIWMAELMNSEAANKLLKLIEEPPERTLILMVGTDSLRLLPTIRSRVQVLSFPPLSAQEIEGVISKRSEEDESAQRYAALHAEGSIAKAMDDLGLKDDRHVEAIMDWLRLGYQRKVVDVMGWCDSQVIEGREEIIRLLIAAQEVFRASFRKNYVSDPREREDALAIFTKRFAPFIHARNAMSLMEHTDKAIADIERNGNARIVLLDYSFHVIKLLRIKNEIHQNV
jgi:DNA polymerase-3 subunit delta'